MRVISGLARGHKLVAPEGLDTRPTTDRIKETLFNIISGKIYDSNFLDLFCGSGAIGIEALSRGSKMAVFVDNGNKAIESVNQNLNHTKLIDKASVIKNDVFTVIKELGAKNQKFDVIFMDPPYAAGLYGAALKAISDANILAPEGIIITEQPSKIENPVVKGLNLLKTKNYKTTIMSFWTLED